MWTVRLDGELGAVLTLNASMAPTLTPTRPARPVTTVKHGAEADPLS